MDITPSAWSPATMAIALFAGGAFIALTVKLLWGMAQWGRKTPHRVGEDMANTRAEVTEWADGEGYVRAGGELWRATAKETLAPGDKVAVTHVDGLTLQVRKQ